MKEVQTNPENPFFAREALDHQDKKLREAVNKIAMAVCDIELSEDEYFGVAPRAVLVGGYVRDLLLKKHPKDADLEVYGVNPERLKHLLVELFGPDKVDTVGAAFGVLKVFLGNGLDVDVSVPRRESKTTRGHRGFEIIGDPAMSIKEAARRRDFTINALAMDPLSGEIFDSFGGMEDLEKKILRVTDHERFQDDSLRVLRAVQFAARLGFEVNGASKQLMREMVSRGDLRELPAERILGEFEKLLLKSERPSVGLELMREFGILESHFPELNALIGCEQDPGFHPEGDVWTHTKLVVDAAASLFKKRFPKPEEMLEGDYKQIHLSVMLGVLLHDIGKPATTKREADGKIHSYEHEAAGEEPARGILTRLNVAKAVEENVLRMVRFHRLPEDQYENFAAGEMSERQYAAAVRRMLDRIKDLPWPALLVVCEADYLGSAPREDKPAYRPLAEIARVVSEFKMTKTPLLLGRDVLAAWQRIKGKERAGGPWIGEIIQQVTEKEEHPDRDSALTRMEEIITAM